VKTRSNTKATKTIRQKKPISLRRPQPRVRLRTDIADAARRIVVLPGSEVRFVTSAATMLSES